MQNTGTRILIIIIVHVPQPNTLVPAAGGEELPARGPGHALHLVLVALQARPALVLPALLVPDGNSSVKTCAGQELSTGGPGHPSDGSLMALGQDCLAHPGLPLPDPQSDSLVLATGGQDVT